MPKLISKIKTNTKYFFTKLKSIRITVERTLKLIEYTMILCIAIIIIFIGTVLFIAYFKVVFFGETEWTKRVSEPVAKMINLLGKNWRALVILIPFFLISIKKIVRILSILFPKGERAPDGKVDKGRLTI